MSADLNGQAAPAPASDTRFRDLIAQAPVAMSVLRGPEHIIETTNAAMLRIVGRGEEIIGKPTLESFPEVADQPVWEMMQGVYHTGNSVRMDEVPLTLMQAGGPQEGFYNISYTPLVEDGAITGVLQVVSDVTAQVHARRTGEQQSAFLQNAIDIGELGTYSVDVATATGSYSENIRQWFGLEDLQQPVSFVLGKVHPEDQPAVRDAIARSQESETDARHDITYRIPDPSGGAPRHLRSIGKALFTGGRAHTITGIIQDVTATKATESQLKYRQALLEAQNEAIPDAILIVDTKGGMISFNRHFAEVWGIPDEIIARKDDAAALEFAVTQLVAPKAFIEQVNYCYAHPDEARDHEEILFKDGRTIERWGNAVVGEDGTRYGWAWYFCDITARKKADEALRQSEQRFRSIFNGQFLFLAILAPDGTVLDVNELPLQAGDMQREEVLGKVFWDTTWWRDLPQMRASWPRRLEQAAATDGPLFTEDLFQTSTGETRVADAAVTAVRDAGGRVEFFIVQASDITERKQAEESLRASEDRYQSFVRQSSEGIWRFEMSVPVPVDLPVAELLDRIFERAHLAECNDAMAQMYGYEKAEELIGARITDFMPRDAESEAYLTHFITSGCRVADAESREKDRDGADRYFMNNVLGIVEDGKIQRAWGTQRDITEQRAAEVRLRESEAQFRDFSNNLNNLAWIADGEGWIYWYNQRWYGYTGATFDEMQGWGWEKMHHPEHIGRVLNFVKDAWLQDEPFELTFPLRGKDGEYRWFLTRVVPVFDADGKRYRWIGTNTDVHEQVLAQRKIEESEALFSTVTNSSPTGLWLSDEEGGLTYLNKTLTEWTGMPYESLLGAGWAGAIIEDDRPRTAETFRAAVAERAHYDVMFRLRKGDGNIVWCRAAGDPYYGEDGSYAGYAGFCMDIEEQMQGRKALEESEVRFRSLIEEAPVATCLFVGRELRVEVANSAMLDLWGKGADALNKPLAEALPELEGQPFLQILDDVFSTGVAYHATAAPATIVRDGVPGAYYFDFTYKPLRDTKGDVYAIMNMAVEVTEQVMAQRRVEKSEENLRSLVESAPFPIGVYVGKEMRIQLVNQAVLDVWGKGREIVGELYADVLPELKGSGIYEQLDGVFTTGVPFHARQQRVDLEINGVLKPQYFNYSFTPLFDGDGQVYGVMNTAAELTDLVTAKQQVEEAQGRLRGAVELAELGTWEIDVAANTITFSERLQQWFGFTGEKTSMGLVYNPIHERDRERIEAAVARAMQLDSGGIYDEEYALVAQSTGQQRVVHAQGKTFFDEEGNAVKMSGTAQDVTRQRALQAELERQVQERTAELDAAARDLTRSNEELSQYAYVASHDLQEPLRKIRMFSGILEKQKGVAEEIKPMVARISQAAERMSLLIQNLLEFSRLQKSETLMRPVALGGIVAEVTKDFELVVAEKGAVIDAWPLPVVEAVGLQMNQLFYNLIGNALKFSKPGIPPGIRIRSEAAPAEEVAKHIPDPLPAVRYHHLTVSDNGIGFEVKYADQIFEVFKRLHGRDEYAGSGIGLALCRRIVANHGGALWAESEAGAGTTFHMLLPERRDDYVSPFPEHYTQPQ